MNWVIAIIQPHRLDAVREALSAINVHGMTITEVRGFGRQLGHTEIYRGSEYKIAYVPKLKVEVAVPDGELDGVVEAITTAARTGKIGDGKIFVLDLKEALRIRIDDSLDVLAVHGVGGATGTLLAGFFATLALGGIGLAEGVTVGGQFSVQLMGAAATLVWSVVASVVIIKVTQAICGLRVTDESAIEGLDFSTHGERGYNL